MNSRLFLLLASFQSFWRARAAASRLHFYLSRWGLSVLRHRDAEIAESRAFRSVFRLTTPQMLFAVGTAVAAQLANPSLAQLYSVLGWRAPEDGIYGTLLGAVTSMGAVLIGLYYAGLTAVGSSAYARLPENVRELLVRERVGNAYMRFLAFLTYFSLCMLCLRVLGYPRVEIAVPIVMVLSGVGVLGFINLGQRAFRLFDPVTISDATFLELQMLTTQAAAGGFRWRDASFQRYAHDRASECLDAIESLRMLCSTEHHLAKRSQLSLLRRLVWFLCQYCERKSAIPTSSQWYERANEHPDWYRSDDSSVSIAYQTGTAMRPVEVVERRWVEARLEPLLISAITEYASIRSTSEAHQVLMLLATYSKRLAAVGDVVHAVELWQRLGDATIKWALSVDNTSESPERTDCLGLVEAIASFPIDICIQYGLTCEHTLLPGLNIDRDVLAAGGRALTFRAGAPRELLERLEWFTDRLWFERAVEGCVITPQWYVKELIAVVAAGVHAANVDALNRVADQTYTGWFKRAREAGRPWLFAAIMSRQREFLNKMDHWQSSFATCWSKLTSDRRVPGLKWPELDFAHLAADRVQGSRELLGQHISFLLSLIVIERPKHFPDYFGQFLHAAGEEVFEAILRGDSALLQSVFPFYFAGSLATFERLRGTHLEPTEEGVRSVRIAAGPILDLVELTGYAKLFASVHPQPALWTIVESVWSHYLDENVTPRRIGALAALLSISEAPMTIPMRGILRTGWEQRVANKLTTLPRRHVSRGLGLVSAVEVVMHADPLVRIFASKHFGMYDGADIFIDLYLKSRPDAEGLNFPSWKNLQDKVTSEIDFYERYAPQDRNGLHQP